MDTDADLKRLHSWLYTPLHRMFFFFFSRAFATLVEGSAVSLGSILFSFVMLLLRGTRDTCCLERTLKYIYTDLPA